MTRLGWVWGCGEGLTHIECVCGWWGEEQEGLTQLQEQLRAAEAALRSGRCGGREGDGEGGRSREGRQRGREMARGRQTGERRSGRAGESKGEGGRERERERERREREREGSDDSLVIPPPTCRVQKRVAAGVRGASPQLSPLSLSHTYKHTNTRLPSLRHTHKHTHTRGSLSLPHAQTHTRARLPLSQTHES